MDNNLVKYVKPMFPQYKLYSKRLHTFCEKEWPIGLSQSSDELALAGFFYTGLSDKVICFSCAGGLNKWKKSDIPLFEHLRSFPDCMFAQLLASKPNVCNSENGSTSNVTLHPNEKYKLQESNCENNNQDSDTISLSRRFCSLFSRGSIPTQEKNKENEKHMKISDEYKMCKICMVEERNVAIAPCGHFVLCSLCAGCISQCPVCRCNVKHFTKIYFS